MRQPLYIVPFSTCTYIYIHTLSKSKGETLPITPTFSHTLTVSGEELPEVYGDHNPFTEVVPVAPQADVHGARAGLTVHTA